MIAFTFNSFNTSLNPFSSPVFNNFYFLYFYVVIFLIYILIGGKLLDNALLVSTVQQRESVIIIYIYLPSISSLPPLQVITEH